MEFLVTAKQKIKLYYFVIKIAYVKCLSTEMYSAKRDWRIILNYDFPNSRAFQISRDLWSITPENFSNDLRLRNFLQVFFTQPFFKMFRDLTKKLQEQFQLPKFPKEPIEENR